MRRAGLVALLISVAAFAPARADEACRRDPEPICVMDWAAVTVEPGRTTAYALFRVFVRLRLDRIEEADRVVGVARLRGVQNFVTLELRARTGDRETARAGFMQLLSRWQRVFDDPGSSVNLLMPDYLPIVDSLRRSGLGAEAKEAALRAATAVRAWQTRQAADTGAPYESAKLLAEIGRAHARAGDRAAAVAALAEAAKLAPLPTEDLDKALDVVSDHLRTFAEIGALGHVLGQSDVLRGQLTAVAARATAATGAATGIHARRLFAILARVAAIQGHTGDREGALASVAAAKPLLSKLVAEGVAAAELETALFDAYLALGDWAAAAGVVTSSGEDRMRAYYLELLVEAQAGRGALKTAVESALTAPADKQPNLLRVAALAATAAR